MAGLSVWGSAVSEGEPGSSGGSSVLVLVET